MAGAETDGAGQMRRDHAGQQATGRCPPRLRSGVSHAGTEKSACAWPPERYSSARLPWALRITRQSEAVPLDAIGNQGGESKRRSTGSTARGREHRAATSSRQYRTLRDTSYSETRQVPRMPLGVAPIVSSPARRSWFTQSPPRLAPASRCSATTRALRQELLPSAPTGMDGGKGEL